jgi:hypothetical protein
VRVAYTAGYLQLKTNADAEALNGGGMDSQIQRKGKTVDVQLCSPQKQGLLSWRFPWVWSRENTLDWTVDLTEMQTNTRRRIMKQPPTAWTSA